MLSWVLTHRFPHVVHANLQRGGRAHAVRQSKIRVGQHFDLIGQHVQRGTSQRQQRNLHVSHICYRSEGAHHMHLGIVFGSTGGHHKERGAALGVTKVTELRVARLGQHCINHGRQIVQANLVPREAPVSLVCVGIQLGMALGVTCAACITHPDIVASLVQKVTESAVRPHHYPRGGAVQQAVHEEHRLGTWPGNTMYFQHVVILGGHLVLLCGILVLLQQFHLHKRKRELSLDWESLTTHRCEMRIFQHTGGVIVLQKSSPALAQPEQAQAKRSPPVTCLSHGEHSTKTARLLS